MPYKDAHKYKEWQRKAYRNRRYIQLRRATLLLGGCCVGCGTVHNLQFDHLDPATKLFDVGQKAGCLGWARLKVEILKCRLLCIMCHMERTRLQRQGIEWVAPDPWDGGSCYNGPCIYDDEEDFF